MKKPPGPGQREDQDHEGGEHAYGPEQGDHQGEPPQHDGSGNQEGEFGAPVRSNQRLRWHLSEFERSDHTVLSTSDAWETDIEVQGHDPTHQDLQVEQITPPPAIAARLKLDPRSDVCVVRRHVRYIDGKPAIISDDHFDESIVRGTELAAPEDTTPACRS